MSALKSAGVVGRATPGRDEQTARVMKSAWRMVELARDNPGCDGNVLSKFCGQATKGAWWMPWQKQAMKDVASCDKPRGAASRH
jgi:hypothetical protein